MAGPNGKTALAQYRGIGEGVPHSDFPKEMITAGKDFDEALGRAVLRDDNQRNAVVLLKQWMDSFNEVTPEHPDGVFTTRIQGLTNWLNASPAVGGYNRAQALMAHTGLVVGEALGVKMGKDSTKALAQAQMRAQQTSTQQEQSTQ